MKLSRVLASGGLAVVAGLFLLGTSSRNVDAATKQVLNWSEPSSLETLDPDQVDDSVGGEVLRNSNEGLYVLDGNNKLKLAGASNVTVSKDEKTYTFTLRKNAKWSNGKAVVAADYVYGWRRMVTPATAAPNAYLFDGIQNAEDIMNSKKSPDTLGVKAVGKYKLVVTLDKTIPYFKKLLVIASFNPLNENAVNKYGKKYGTSSKYTLYNGPFVVKGWTGTNDKWNLQKNNYYWDKDQVKLAKINFQVTKSTTTSYNLYQSGKLDETLLSSEQARQLKNNKEFKSLEQARTTYVDYNTTRKALKNKNIRKALSYAVNRKQLVKKVLGDGSVVSKNFVPEGLTSYKGKDFAKDAQVKEASEHSKTLAKKYWKKGLKELGVKKLTLTFLSDDDDASKNTGEFLQSQYETTLPGLTVNLSDMPKKNRITKMMNQDFDLVLTGWGAEFTDPLTYLNLMTSDNVYNFGKWNNSDYDKYVSSAKNDNASDAAGRWKAMTNATNVLDEEQPLALLYQPTSALLLKSNVKGVKYNSVGGFVWKNAYIK
ncbi:MAG: peptide ABC transporter substrate-binding protein [Liquorilactobacillus hordei]|uniref:peptide ABC transporter substrate-binding protein n=1 Tax=Liquorilactobacillus hordei TaxID=468911 RepID=UPI0039E731CA